MGVGKDSGAGTVLVLSLEAADDSDADDEETISEVGRLWPRPLFPPPPPDPPRLP